MTVENSPEQIRNKTLSEYLEIIARARDATKPPLTSRQIDEMAIRQQELKQAYFDNLPIVPLSKCPFCQQAFKSRFDPWGVDGLWWQENELTLEMPEVENCKHFVLMQGAVNLNGQPPQGGFSKSLTGPEQPFVAPRILNHSGMQMIVSKFDMANGYTAYPLIYFAARHPDPAKLMETWRCETYGWTTKDGRTGWSTAVDPWDFELRKWIDEKKVGWIKDSLTPASNDRMDVPVFGIYDSYPFSDVKGRMARLQIIEDGLIECALPDGNETNPFL